MPLPSQQSVRGGLPMSGIPLAGGLPPSATMMEVMDPAGLHGQPLATIHSDPMEVLSIIADLSDKLGQCVEALQAEMVRAQHNHGVVRRHQEELHGERAIAHYEQAGGQLAERYGQLAAVRMDFYARVLELDRYSSQLLMMVRDNVAGIPRREFQ